MKDTAAKILSVSLSTLIVLSILVGAPVFSGFPPRSYTGPGLGYATFYVTPQDTLITSSKPIDNKVGTWFPIQIRMSNFTHVYSWQYQLIFQSDLLTVYPENVTEVVGTDYVFSGKPRTALSVSVDPYNATFTRILASVSCQGATPPVSGTDKGVTDILLQIAKDPDAPNTLSTMLFFQTSGDGVSDDTWTLDEGGVNENDCTMLDGYYENKYVAPPPAYLSLAPTTVTMPVIAGDRIVGTPRAFFDVDIMINSIVDPPMTKLFFVQLAIHYDPAVIEGTWVYEGTFMNNPAWAPHGTIDNLTVVDPGVMYWWIMISPNSGGTWADNTAWPSGSGKLATARFEVINQLPNPGVLTSVLDLEPVFGQYFIGDPDGLADYLPFDTAVDSFVTVNGYNWAGPVAVKTHTPASPLVGETTTFDGSASYGYRNILGVLTPDPTYIASYFWDFGDGFNSSVGPITTHAYAAMGTYTVSLNVTDLDDNWDIVTQEITVVFGRLIDVYIGTGTGAYPAPYGGQGQDNVADMFEPQKTVCVYANVTYNGDAVQSKLVTFIIISPHNLHDFSRSAITDVNGQAYIEFGLPWPCVDPVNEIFGIWNITVKVDIRSTVVEDTVAFKVWWLIETTSVVPKASSFIKGGSACFDITFRTYRMQPIDGVLEITLYDDLDVPFAAARMEFQGIGWGNYTWCMFKNYTVTICLDVPKWAFVGTGKAYVNFFHYDPTNPYNMGSPYCPEVTCTFGIVKPIL